MVGIPLLLDMEPVSSFLRDADGNVRGALICWGIALGAFVVLRVPRQALLACLFVATVTVGFAAVVVEATPIPAIASPAKPPLPVRYRAVPLKTESPAAADSATDSPL
jgi:hypothetical protein